MTDEEYDAQEEAAERIGSLKRGISDVLKEAGALAYPYQLENDIYVSGPLTVILEAVEGWRSELEELGD